MSIWDTVALFRENSFRSDFIGYVKCDFTLKDLNKVNRAVVVVTNLRNCIDVRGNDVFLICLLCHLT